MSITHILKWVWNGFYPECEFYFSIHGIIYYISILSFTGIFSCQKIGVSVMVFNATFNNILVISWQSVLMVEETGISGDRHWLHR